MATKQCPYCAETIQAQAVVCRFCGRPLTPAINMPPPIQPSPKASAGAPTVWITPQKKGNRGCLSTIGIVIVIFLILAVVNVFTGDTDLSTGSSLTTTRPRSVLPTPTLDLAARRASASSPTYDDLARNTERWIGQLVRLQGEVIQVSEGWGNEVVLRVNITKGEYYWSDAIWVNYTEPPRVLEDDLVEFLGTVDGRRTYEAVLGNSVTVPEVTAYELIVTGKSE